MSKNTSNAANHKVKLKKGDLVRVIAGKDRSAKNEGRILRIDREKCRVMVENVNIVKKSKKPQRQGEQGEIVEVEAFMDISNVMLVCPAGCGPVRISYSLGQEPGKKKERICRKCERVIG